ncbi:uncharacterized protein LOC110464464 [Mizuhopecten yessoensis]|uniref:uncharacterized protein LOC110464464 n=1 Tax=Mizuhopecten yessoensis TaxID=6573 RepID=UPI000B45DC32|nr:uncharacterized protein LOC110464464 [Mizuhopecten yessoensis]
MATNYQSSKETTNFARICRVVIDVIPDLLRDLLNTRLPLSGLSAVLTTQKRKIFSGLKQHQKNILYPQGGGYQGSVKDLDTSLLYILLRNIGNIPPHQNGWGKVPGIADRSLSANIDRLREQRNEAAHAPNGSLSDGDFQARWDIIRQSVEEIQNGELNTVLFVVAVDDILTMEMDHRMTNKYIAELLLDIKDDVGKVKDDIHATKEDVKTLKDDSSTMKDDVGEVKKDVGAMKEDIGATKEEVGAVKEDVGAMKEDVGAVKEDVGDVKEDVGAMKEDIGATKEDVGAVKEDVGAMKEDVGAVKEDVGALKEDVGAMKEDVGAVKEDVGAMKEDVGAVKEDVGAVKKDVGAVKKDVGAVKKDVGAVKEDVGAVKEDVGAVKEDVGAVKEDVGAVKEDVGAVKEDVATVRADVSSMKDKLNTLPTGTSHIKDRDPKLTAMIERTTAMILKEKDEYKFFPTKSLQDAYDKLMKNSLVVIKGNSGDGKTSIAFELLRRLCYNEEGQQCRQPLELHDIKDLDYVTPESQLVIYLDDIFGKNVVCRQDVEEWEKREKYVISNFCGNEHTEGNFLIVAIRSGISNSLTGSCSEKVFTKQNIVDLNIDAKEKLELLRLYKPKVSFDSWKDDEEKEIVKCAPDIGFPQCCRLFRDSPTLQTERVNFFKRPFDFLKSSLSKLEDGKCYGLMYLFLNGGKVMEDDLDSNNENIDEKLLEAAFKDDVVEVTPTTELVYSKSKGRKIEFVKKSLDCLLGWMVKKEPNNEQRVCYQFNHDSIEETLALLYGEKTPIGYIQNCPSKFLSYVTTSKTTPNKVVISSDNQYNVMYKRLLGEFESVFSSNSDQKSHWFYSKYSKYHSITSLDVWTDIQFLQGFITWLIMSGQNVGKSLFCKIKFACVRCKSRQNDDKNLCHVIKLALLNGACSSGSEDCVLFLLSEGVKPDKETPFCVVEQGSVSMLCKLLEYDVTQTARLYETRSPHQTSNINVLQEACLFEREEMVTILCNTYPHLVHDTDDEGRSTLHLVAETGNCDIFKTVERVALASLYKDKDEQHKCETVEGRVVHRNCVCAQYMCQLVNKWRKTVLHSSCMMGHIEVCKYLCESYPALTTAVNKTGKTVLHWL